MLGATSSVERGSSPERRSPPQLCGKTRERRCRGRVHGCQAPSHRSENLLVDDSGMTRARQCGSIGSWDRRLDGRQIDESDVREWQQSFRCRAHERRSSFPCYARPGRPCRSGTGLPSPRHVLVGAFQVKVACGISPADTSPSANSRCCCNQTTSSRQPTSDAERVQDMTVARMSTHCRR